MRIHPLLLLSCCAPLLALYGCDDQPSDPEASGLDLDEDASPDAGHASPASGSLSTNQQTPAVPGFAIDITVQGDDVILDWTAAGLSGVDVRVFRSQEAGALIDATDLPNADAEELVAADGTTLFADVGAADHAAPTPTYFYRVVVDGVASTMVLKRSTAMAPGYNKFGMCMLDGPSRASDVAAQLGSSVSAVITWDAVAQSYVRWRPMDGVGGAADYDIPMGSVIAAHVDASTPAYQTLVGTVPTDETAAVSGEPGHNWSLFPAMYDGPTNASYWVDLVGYVAFGTWTNTQQKRRWYRGPHNTDLDVEPCEPFYTYLSDDACTSNDDCNADAYCDFDAAAACGEVAAGLCAARPIGCEFAPAGEVCGCDGQAYPSACEAELAGVALSDDQTSCLAPTVYDVVADFELGSAPGAAQGTNGWYYLYDATNTSQYTELEPGSAYWGFESWRDPTCTEASFWPSDDPNTIIMVPPSVGACDGTTALAWEAPADGAVDIDINAGLLDPACVSQGVHLELHDESGAVLWSQTAADNVVYEQSSSTSMLAGERVYLRVDQGAGGSWCDSVYFNMVVHHYES
ncbi:MAG: hypothetical protein ACRBN8_39580 [Nannocystales bacterium]